LAHEQGHTLFLRWAQMLDDLTHGCAHKYFFNVVDNMLYATCSQTAAFEGGESVQSQYIFLQVLKSV